MPPKFETVLTTAQVGKVCDSYGTGGYHAFRAMTFFFPGEYCNGEGVITLFIDCMIVHTGRLSDTPSVVTFVTYFIALLLVLSIQKLLRVYRQASPSGHDGIIYCTAYGDENTSTGA